MRVPQADELLVKAEHGVGPRELLCGVYLPVVRVHHYPGLALGEAGVFARVPLHGRPGVVAALVAQEAQHLLGAHASAADELVVGVDALYVAEVLKAAEGGVRHGQLLALIDVGRALHHVDGEGDGLGALLAQLGRRVVAEAGDYARLVVIAPV